MPLHYPPPGKTRASMTRVVFLYLQLSINVLVVYAVREAHSTKRIFFGKTRSLVVFLVSLGLSNRLLRESSRRLRCDSAILREAESAVEVS